MSTKFPPSRLDRARNAFVQEQEFKRALIEYAYKIATVSGPRDMGPNVIDLVAERVRREVQ